VQKLLKEIRDAWEEMLIKTSQEAVATEAANKEAATRELGESDDKKEEDSDEKGSIGGSLDASA
jgi:hypothetical protein